MSAACSGACTANGIQRHAIGTMYDELKWYWVPPSHLVVCIEDAAIMMLWTPMLDPIDGKGVLGFGHPIGFLCLLLTLV